MHAALSFFLKNIKNDSLIIKRLFDLFISASLLLLSFPILFLISLSILFFMGRPIFFRQIRPGLMAKPFVIYKFRTMSNNLYMNGRFMSDSQRLTRLGKILRSSSLDELPTLWNVIIGDMSLVGPRPLLVEYIPLYNKMQARRHNVKPGVTGWAQINGRNALSWQDKFKLDVWYTKNQSFLLDFKILLMTFRKVITLDGIGEKGQLTVSKFKGNKN